MAQQSRGIRNNNPGNIDRTNVAWKGMSPDQNDPRFITFLTPEWGIRAIAIVLLNYWVHDGCRTIRLIINRWAPPQENDTDAYIADVAGGCGAGPDDPIDARSPVLLEHLVRAIIRHENGEQPYSDAQINAGISLALEGGA